MNYFWDLHSQAYYLRLSKNGRNIFNYDDPVELVDAGIEAHMKDEKQHDVPEGDVVMYDAPLGYDHGVGYGTSYVYIVSVMIMLQDMQQKQDKRYVEDCQWRNTFEAAQMEQFNLVQQHMSAQDSNFEAFASYVTESIGSLRNDMNTHYVETMARVNHLISTQEEDFAHNERFYRELYDY